MNTYHVHWSDEDFGWVATNDNHPSLSWIDASPITALRMLMEVIYDEILDRRQN